MEENKSTLLAQDHGLQYSTAPPKWNIPIVFVASAPESLPHICHPPQNVCLCFSLVQNTWGGVGSTMGVGGYGEPTTQTKQSNQLTRNLCRVGDLGLPNVQNHSTAYTDSMEF